MKYSQLIGIITAILIIATCYLPWSIVQNPYIIIKGMDANGTDFGRPGLLNIVLCCIMIVLYAIPKLWAKRANLFIAAINMAWSFRNYLLVTTCFFGECPVKQPALFVLQGLSIITLFMSFYPKVSLKERG
ncbi:hypothetical protein [Parasediminibacterium sp. JCM 36343]|uniref:hypothetical protein n=1 Tax=Parasediminibacterium sp. JCM 36343 TaxID=3374279 RepID=UPI003978FAB3